MTIWKAKQMTLRRECGQSSMDCVIPKQQIYDLPRQHNTEFGSLNQPISRDWLVERTNPLRFQRNLQRAM